MNQKDTSTIRIKNTTKLQLEECGRMGMTYDAVIQQLIQAKANSSN